MSNQNNNENNEDERAIIALGNIFKIFALIATLFVIALLIYIAFNSEKSAESMLHYALSIPHSSLKLSFSEHIEEDLRVFSLVRFF